MERCSGIKLAYIVWAVWPRVEIVGLWILRLKFMVLFDRNEEFLGAKIRGEDNDYSHVISF